MCVVLLAAVFVPGQNTQLPATSTDSSNHNGESNSAQPPDAPTFKVNVALVPVRVVVRDAHGVTVGSLRKEDFQILDRGKPQVISQFSVEEATEQQQSSRAGAPDRFVTYLFDDIHLSFGDLANARDAFERHLDSLRPTDRAALVTTSGRTVQNFTADKAKLRKVSELVNPVPAVGAPTCPTLSYYMADQIENKHNMMLTTSVVASARSCGASPKFARNLVSAAARQRIVIGEQQTRQALAALKYVVQVTAKLPGQRIIILVSPGFLTPDLEFEYSEVIDQALHGQVVVNVLDARGVFVVVHGESEEQKNAEGQILAALAEGTGGELFHGSNDLQRGFTTLATPPEYSYLLGFAPQDMKADGKFHKLKISGPAHLTIQARPGYYAPKPHGKS